MLTELALNCGNGEVLPGICAVCLWAIPLTILLGLVRKSLGAYRFTFSVFLLTFLWLWCCANYFELWFAFLGEGLALALVLLTHWVAAYRPLTPRQCLLTGLLAGLALLTKLIALFSLTGVFLIIAYRIWAVHRERNRTALLLLTSAFAGAFLAPTLLFEGYKLFELGLLGYVRNGHECRMMMKSLGSPRIPGLNLLKERWATLQVTYSAWYLSLPVVFLLALWKRRVQSHPARVALAMGISSLTGIAYWFCNASAMTRYAFLPVGLATAGVAIQVASLNWRKPWIPCCILLAFLPGLPRVTRMLGYRADRGLFRPSSNRLARAAATDFLRVAQSREPVVLVSPWWGSFVDLEYLLPKTMNFVLPANAPQDAPRIFLVVNTAFTDIKEPHMRAMLAKSRRMLFCQKNFQIHQLR